MKPEVVAELKEKHQPFFSNECFDLTWMDCALFVNDVMDAIGLRGERIGPMSFRQDWNMMASRVSAAYEIVTTAEVLNSYDDRRNN